MLLLGTAACLGIFLGVAVFCSLDVVEVTGSTMLPELEPGDRVLVLRDTPFFESSGIQVGDLVLHETPYYTADGEGRKRIRRVTGIRGSWLRLNCDAKTVKSQETMVRRDRILGEVILVIPRLKIF